MCIDNYLYFSAMVLNINQRHDKSRKCSVVLMLDYIRKV